MTHPDEVTGEIIQIGEDVGADLDELRFIALHAARAKAAWEHYTRRCDTLVWRLHAGGRGVTLSELARVMGNTPMTTMRMYRREAARHEEQR